MQGLEVLKGEELKGKARLYLEEAQKELRYLHEKGLLTGRQTARRRAWVMDSLISSSLVALGFSKLQGISIVAIGGYGRSELCPYSDIDLLFLYLPGRESLAKEVVEGLLYVLWDLNLDIGYSVRDMDECMDIARGEDTTILTSLLDGRFLFGDKSVYEEFDRRLFKGLLPVISEKFIERKLEENRLRIERFGRSVYLLEPHVKEGEGGLRDIHMALWISKAKFKVRDFEEILKKAILLERELRVFEKSLDFLLRIRTELHHLAGRKEDRLSFEWQETVASFLGYKDVGDIKAVERFMRIYYLRANLTSEYSKRLIERCVSKPKISFKAPKTVFLENGFIIQGGLLSVSNRDLFRKHPENLVKAYEIADRYRVKMSKYLVDLIRDNVKLIDDRVRRNPEFNASFLRILKEGREVADTLFEMNRVRLLSYYIPEFGKIVCMVQHDAYHVYTVDVHSIFMVREIENLIKGRYEKEFPRLTRIAREIPKRHILYLACLFHDMGKGEGRNHAQRGAEMVPRIAQRMGLSREESELLEFMVKHHLVMPHFSQRRDLHDDSLIIRFAKSVKTLETLSLLYLLSFADIRSVGPDVWTNWKGMLLEELYLRTAHVIEHGKFQKEKPEDRKRRFIQDVVRILKEEIPEEKIKGYLECMPYHYFSGFSPQKIAYHIKLIERYGDSIGMDVIFHPSEEYDEFTFWGYDEPGIFSKLCGVIAAGGINILGARIITRGDGRIIDVFYVNRMGKSTYEEKEIWEKVKRDLYDVISGKLDVEEIVSRKKRYYNPAYEKPIPRHPTRIEVDNDSSDTYTVIDIYTHDRVGLLYDITKTLTRLGLSIDYAKISTKVDQVADVFYVREIGKGKIVDSEKIEELKMALFSAIEESP
ncbi:MAG: bifunctional uridylyltransferase/uridylyl-removing enzyme [Deltaproteobacteria bacterium]|jgi:[protein-PII] uridylyltransferase|nr:MAG: bifunctional uridylyltransferase/uridylyl-removing enzyme [Deltaproteobacteria bacterium]